MLRQQEALASFGSFAFRQTDLQTILQRASEVCAECLDVPMCKVCRYRPESGDLLVVAGYGWKAGVVGRVISPADGSSPQGEAFTTGLPQVCSDINADNRFMPPDFYVEHGVISTVDVLVKGSTGPPYGVLEMDSPVRNYFDADHIGFLTGFANVLAEAVATAENTEHLRQSVLQMQAAVEEKNVLAQELQHRVRNSLHLVHAMLMAALDEDDGRVQRADVASIALRVMSMAQVYENLLGRTLGAIISFGDYLRALCKISSDAQGTSSSITVTCDAAEIFLGIDVATTLGIVVTELITNAYGHAFPSGTGRIDVSLRREVSGQARLTVADDGIGFDPAIETKRRGIGLVRRLMSQVAGSAITTFGGGTTWTLTFPTAS